MEDILPEEQLTRLLPALRPLAEHISAEHISDGDTVDQDALQDILSSKRIDSEDWSIQELRRWADILVKAHNASSDIEKDAIKAELEERGILEFPARLAVELASPKPLSVKPQYIDFGRLIPGEGADVTLTVTGGHVKATTRDSRIKLTMFNRGSGVTLVKVILSGGSDERPLQADIILQGERGQLMVPVKARWLEPPLLSWCPICADQLRKKSLFYNKYARRYECFHCKHEFPYNDKSVRAYNEIHD